MSLKNGGISSSSYGAKRMAEEFLRVLSAEGSRPLLIPERDISRLWRWRRS